jgi:hypothetical protein
MSPPSSTSDIRLCISERELLALHRADFTRPLFLEDWKTRAIRACSRGPLSPAISSRAIAHPTHQSKPTIITNAKAKAATARTAMTTSDATMSIQKA